MPPLGVVVDEVMADFKLGFGYARDATAVEQLGFEAAPRQFGMGMGVVVAVAAPADTLRCAVFGNWGFELGSCVLTALVGAHDEPGRRAAHV